MFTKTTLTLMAAMAVLSAGAFAQTPPPAHHGLFGKLFHHTPKPGMTGMGAPGMAPMHHSMLPFHHGMTPGGHTGMMGGGGSAAPMAGGVVGNKNTHVYHMPGDNNLPSAQNRVYFPNAAAAEAAGYHAAGSGHAAGATHAMHASHSKHH